MLYVLYYTTYTVCSILCIIHNVLYTTYCMCNIYCTLCMHQTSYSLKQNIPGLKEREEGYFSALSESSRKGWFSALIENMKTAFLQRWTKPLLFSLAKYKQTWPNKKQTLVAFFMWPCYFLPRAFVYLAKLKHKLGQIKQKTTLELSNVANFKMLAR